MRSPLVWTRKAPTVRFCESVDSANVFMTAIPILLAVVIATIVLVVVISTINLHSLCYSFL